jgi:hypothetical protein
MADRGGSLPENRATESMVSANEEGPARRKPERDNRRLGLVNTLCECRKKINDVSWDARGINEKAVAAREIPPLTHVLGMPWRAQCRETGFHDRRQHVGDPICSDDEKIRIEKEDKSGFYIPKQ